MDQNNSIDHRFIYSLFEDMIKYKINYGYRGEFTQAVSDGLIAFAQSIFNVSGIKKKTKKRAFYILVECVQNITRHQELPDKETPLNDGIFLIQSAGEMFNISQGNMIQKEHVESLEHKLQIVNKLESTDLKDYYKSVLKDQTISQKGGAGLGLIEIARKSGNKIDYKFKGLNDQFSFFFMDTLISDPAAPKPEVPVSFYGIDITEKLMSKLGENHINLVYCSQFSDQGAFDMLDIIENLKLSKNQSSLVRKRIYTVLVEMLQNISQHGTEMDGKTGILMMGSDGKTNKIITGNMIKQEEEEVLIKHIDHLNSLDNEGLEKFFIERLTNEDLSNTLKNGMGLIDMRIKSENLLVYDMVPLESGFSFFSLQVSINE